MGNRIAIGPHRPYKPMRGLQPATCNLASLKPASGVATTQAGGAIGPSTFDKHTKNFAANPISWLSESIPYRPALIPASTALLVGTAFLITGLVSKTPATGATASEDVALSAINSQTTDIQASLPTVLAARSGTTSTLADKPETLMAAADTSAPLKNIRTSSEAAQILADIQNKSGEYQAQISLLKSQNNELQSKVVTLESETLGLNSELLALEIELATQTENAQQTAEIKTIYNFVNVPIGGQINADEQTSYADNSIDEPPTVIDQVNNIENNISTDATVVASGNDDNANNSAQTFTSADDYWNNEAFLTNDQDFWVDAETGEWGFKTDGSRIGETDSKQELSL